MEAKTPAPKKERGEEEKMGLNDFYLMAYCHSLSLASKNWWCGGMDRRWSHPELKDLHSLNSPWFKFACDSTARASSLVLNI